MMTCSFDVTSLVFDVTSVALATATGCSHGWIKMVGLIKWNPSQ
jgi:hypothetical protein